MYINPTIRDNYRKQVNVEYCKRFIIISNQYYERFRFVSISIIEIKRFNKYHVKLHQIIQ